MDEQGVTVGEWCTIRVNDCSTPCSVCVSYDVKVRERERERERKKDNFFRVQGLKSSPQGFFFFCISAE